MNFLDVKTDYAFKKIFGSDTSKEILISFLNAAKNYSIQLNKGEDYHLLNPIIALNIVDNEANLIKDELEAQHKRKEFISIQRLALMKADTDGFSRGIEQGIEQGKIEERNKLIVKAYRNGTPTTIIGSFVDMSEAEVIDFLRTRDDL